MKNLTRPRRAHVNVVANEIEHLGIKFFQGSGHFADLLSSGGTAFVDKDLGDVGTGFKAGCARLLA